MEPRDIFVNKWGRLRSGWRIAVFLCLYLALLFIVNIALRVIYAIGLNVGYGPGTYVSNVIFRLSILVPALVAGYVCTRALEGLPWRALGLAFHQGWLSNFAIGSVIGSCSLLLAAAIARLAGGLRFSMQSKDALPLALAALSSAAVLFVLAALAEEALFRGYPLQTLTRAKLAWLGVLLTSVPFAAVHLWNPNVVRGFTFANTALAGIWLALAYLRTRSLWFAWGIHWAWNWTLDSVLGLPVSGITISSHPLFHGVDVGPPWLTGGSYGIEGGAACTITLLLSTLFVWRTRLISATPEMLTLTSREKPTPSALSVVPHAEPTPFPVEGK